MTDRKQRSLDAPLGIPARGQENLLEWLYALRDRQRAIRNKGTWLIKAKDVPWEYNRHGKMQWYLHPALENAAIRSMIVFRQEIPPGRRTGAQKTPGDQIIYVVKGRGYTLLDGVRHDWQAEDVVNIPIRAEGVTMQHFNRNKREPALLVCVSLNLADMLGLDRGSALEQIEDAPEGDVL